MAESDEPIVTTHYRTIVADPPWDYPEGFPTQRRRDGPTRIVGLPYGAMSLAEIKALPVRALAQSDVAGNRPDKSVPRDGSVLYLWTTTKYLEAAHDVVRAWGFSPTVVLVWCKAAASGVGGTFAPNVEFVLVGRRGSPRPARDSCPTRWFNWPRGRHSEKPDAFYDLVESVSSGPYVELFARRARFGWDYWGDQSLGTAELSA